jgi:hypothetical protein
MVLISHSRGVPTQTEIGRQRGKETRKMRAYYRKVFRHLLSTTVLTGFLGGAN